MLHVLTFYNSNSLQYWEAATGLHRFSSKMLDSCANLAAFHYQSAHFQKIAPPSFGAYPEVRTFTRNRKRVLTELSLDEYQIKLEHDIIEATESPQKKGFLNSLKNARKRRKQRLSKPKVIHRRQKSEHKPIRTPEGASRKIAASGSFCLSPSASFDESGVRVEDTIASPFLQESAHLFSLLSAVAMSSLRCDLPDVEPPLERWEPDDPFPPVDPDDMSFGKRREYGKNTRLWTLLYSLFGLSRSPAQRTLYNHVRPFKVLGGISHREIEALRHARGPSAKVSLCYMWIIEFMSREHLSGGLGVVPPPIMTRCCQFASDGMKGFHECKKIAAIPFPFPHEQMTAIFIMIIIWIFPILFYSFVNNLFVACLLNYSTVLCFVGLYEVAREMECPFARVPNNLPLTTFQAQFNEALITTWAGYHPDSWFDLYEADLPSVDEANDAPETLYQDSNITEAGLQDWTTCLAEKVCLSLEQNHPLHKEASPTQPLHVPKHAPSPTALDSVVPPSDSHLSTSSLHDQARLSIENVNSGNVDDLHAVPGVANIVKPSNLRHTSFSKHWIAAAGGDGTTPDSVFPSESSHATSSTSSSTSSLNTPRVINTSKMATELLISTGTESAAATEESHIAKPSHIRRVSFSQDWIAAGAEARLDPSAYRTPSSTLIPTNLNQPLATKDVSQITDGVSSLNPVINSATNAGESHVTKPSHSRQVSFSQEPVTLFTWNPLSSESPANFDSALSKAAIEEVTVDNGVESAAIVAQVPIAKPSNVRNVLNIPTPVASEASRDQDNVLTPQKINNSTSVSGGAHIVKPSHSRHVSFSEGPAQLHSWLTVEDDRSSDPDSSRSLQSTDSTASTQVASSDRDSEASSSMNA